MRRRIFIQKSIAFFSSISLNPSFLFNGTTLNLIEFEEAWNSYIKNPIKENSLNLYNAIPLYDNYDNQRKSKLYQQIDEELDLLEQELLTGDEDTIDLAFKLKSITTGEVAYFLNIYLGKTINVKPEYFLRSLNKHYHLCSLGKVLCGYGPDYVDELEMCNVETEKRIESLSTVTDLALQKIKSACIKELESHFFSPEFIDKANMDVLA